jgi:hypothetical protein
MICKRLVSSLPVRLGELEDDLGRLGAGACKVSAKDGADRNTEAQARVVPERVHLFLLRKDSKGMTRKWWRTVCQKFWPFAWRSSVATSWGFKLQECMMGLDDIPQIIQSVAHARDTQNSAIEPFFYIGKAVRSTRTAVLL